MFHQTMFSYLKHCIQQSRGHISLTKAVVLSASTRNFFATIAMHCNNMPLQVKNTTIVYVFCLHSHTVTDLSGTHAFFSRFWKGHCDIIALDVPLVLAGGLFYHVLLVLVLARLKLLCSRLFRLSITLQSRLWLGCNWLILIHVVYFVSW